MHIIEQLLTSEIHPSVSSQCKPFSPDRSVSIFCQGKSRLLLQLPHPSTRRREDPAGRGGVRGAGGRGGERQAAVLPSLQGG